MNDRIGHRSDRDYPTALNHQMHRGMINPACWEKKVVVRVVDLSQRDTTG